MRLSGVTWAGVPSPGGGTGSPSSGGPESVDNSESFHSQNGKSLRPTTASPRTLGRPTPAHPVTRRPPPFPTRKKQPPSKPRVYHFRPPPTTDRPAPANVKSTSFVGWVEVLHRPTACRSAWSMGGASSSTQHPLRFQRLFSTPPGGSRRVTSGDWIPARRGGRFMRCFGNNFPQHGSNVSCRTSQKF